MLGEIISKLPVDVQLGKLIVLGHIFGVLEEAVIIAAGYVFFLNGCQETFFFWGGGAVLGIGIRRFPFVHKKLDY